MTSVRLDSDIENRLARLASITGRTKTFYLKALISENLDDLEDRYISEQRLEEPVEQVTLKEMRTRLELED